MYAHVSCVTECIKCVSLCVRKFFCFVGEWITPTVTGDRPPTINDFTLTSVTNNTAIFFGGETGIGMSNKLYIINCAKTSMVG